MGTCRSMHVALPGASLLHDLQAVCANHCWQVALGLPSMTLSAPSPLAAVPMCSLLKHNLFLANLQSNCLLQGCWFCQLCRAHCSSPCCQGTTPHQTGGQALACVLSDAQGTHSCDTQCSCSIGAADCSRGFHHSYSYGPDSAGTDGVQYWQQQQQLYFWDF